jgi:hypothetical protein
MGRVAFVEMSLSLVLAGIAALAACAANARAEQEIEPSKAPASLLETGFGSLPARTFAPQYPLWSDGATKQRFVYLPAGSKIDASDTNAWRFPIGTKLWKQFAYDDALTETRYMERTAGGWIYATYDATGTLADARGVRGDHPLPSEAECRACHANGKTPVLGFSALQLSSDRDPNAPHAEALGEIDLRDLLVEGTLANAPMAIFVPPRIPGPPIERAALGYLHGNCSGCHREGGAIDSLGMFLDAPNTRATTIDRPSHFAIKHARLRVEPGHPEQSVLFARASSRDPATQMPPLGTRVVDDAAVRTLRTWIATLPETP